MVLQAAACAYLGHYYHEVAKDLTKAKNCYEETLLLDPQNTAVAHALTQVTCSRDVQSFPLHAFTNSAPRDCAERGAFLETRERNATFEHPTHPMPKTVTCSGNLHLKLEELGMGYSTRVHDFPAHLQDFIKENIREGVGFVWSISKIAESFPIQCHIIFSLVPRGLASSPWNLLEHIAAHL